MWIGIKLEIRIRIGIETMLIHNTGINPDEDDTK
jgi:hypothetical protein